MSKESSLVIESTTFPAKPGDWEADTKVWMKVGCNLEPVPESGLRATPVPDSETMNFSIWKDATAYSYLDFDLSEWKSFVFEHANHLSDLDSATLTLYQDMSFWERDILPDLSRDRKTIELPLPNSAPEGYWKKVGSPTKIKYILFKFHGKPAPLSGSFEIGKTHLVRAAPKT